MVESAALDLVEVPVDLADAALQLLRALVQDGLASAGEHRDITVDEIHHLARLS
jgi:hypothetical protein